MADTKSLNLKIAYVTETDPRDKRSWSGTHYYIAQALEKYSGEVVFLGPLRDRYRFFWRVVNKVSQLFLKKRYMYTHRIQLSKNYGKQLRKKLSQNNFNIIFSPASSAAIAFLESSLPIVYLSDATFLKMINYYPDFSGLLAKSARDGNLIEMNAIEKSAALVYSSEWAAESAKNDYGAEESKVFVVPFGANFGRIPSRNLVLSKKRSDMCRLLFVGREWVRKGGNIAFETLLKLLDMGIKTELTICGCVPPRDIVHKNMTVIPFLNKNNKEDAIRLEKLYLDSDFFILPTRAECFGISFCEANSYAIPVITTKTGGLRTVVKDGINGYLLPLSSEGEDYARIILEIYSDEQRYYKLRETSREEYDKRLNWDAWGKTTAGIIKSKLGI